MRRKKICSLFLTMVMAVSMMTACGSPAGAATSEGTTDAQAEGSESTSAKGETKQFTAFFAVPGSEINDDNEIQEVILYRSAMGSAQTS